MRTYTLVFILAFFAAMFCVPKQSWAREHVDLSIGIGGPVVETPAPVVERRWVPEHYETRVAQVLVEPEHYERQWVPPVKRERVDSFGERYTIIIPGYYRRMLIPARYETRETKVFIEGHYQDVAVTPPPIVNPRPAINIGGFLKF